MGLRASFSVTELGYPLATPNLQIPINYSTAAETFVRVFLETAQNLVPVRTGNLMNSIMAESNGSDVLCYTDCEYSQYVEYGTWKQSAQPYFEPALEEAMSEIKTEMDSLYHAALQMEQEEIEKQQEEAEAQAGMMAEEMGFFGQMFLQVIASMIVGFFMGLLKILHEAINGDDVSVSMMMSHVHVETYD